MSAAATECVSAPDRDRVDAGERVGAHRLEVHVAGRLDRRRVGGRPRDRAPAGDGLRGLVVDQDDVGAAGDGLPRGPPPTRPRPRPSSFRERRAGRPRAPPRRLPPARRWLSLMRTCRTARSGGWSRRRRGRPAVEGAQPRRGLARVEDPAAACPRRRRRTGGSPSRSRTSAGGGSGPRARPSGSRAPSRRAGRGSSRRDLRRRPASAPPRRGPGRAARRRAGRPAAPTPRTRIWRRSPRRRRRRPGRSRRSSRRADPTSSARNSRSLASSSAAERPSIRARTNRSRFYDSSSIRSSGFSAALRSSSGSTISGRSSRRQR